jgi:hypothetical protein
MVKKKEEKKKKERKKEKARSSKGKSNGSKILSCVKTEREKEACARKVGWCRWWGGGAGPKGE